MKMAMVPFLAFPALFFSWLCNNSCWGLSPAIRFHSRPSPRSCATRLFIDGEGMAGGISRHLLGDALRALQPRYLSQVADAVAGNIKGSSPVDIGTLTDNAPSWEKIEEALKSKQTADEKMFRANLDAGSGPPSALASLRLFDKATEPRVTLYRDSAAWCPYCQKVWIALEEKKVSYEVIKVDMRSYGIGKSEDFLKLQPSGNLPCAVVDGTVIRESDEIIDAIDSIGSRGSPKLRPEAGTKAAKRLAYLCEDGRNSLERRLYSRWMWWLTGVRKPEEYQRQYEEVLDEVEEALKGSPFGGPYFLGRDISLVDIRFVPFIERQVASAAYFKGYSVRDPTVRPYLAAWLAAMEGRPSYQATKSDWYTHSRALPPQLSAECVDIPEGESLRNLIDFLPGGDFTSKNDGSMATWREPGWEWCDLPKACREAAERVCSNRERIVAFASRSAGKPGLPAVSASLADPRATGNTNAAVAVDLFLRHAVHSLVSGSTNKESSSRISNAVKEAAASLAVGGAGMESLEAVAGCLDYLRARIGVPRDMSGPAAQELRAELGSLVKELRLQKDQHVLHVP